MSVMLMLSPEKIKTYLFIYLDSSLSVLSNTMKDSGQRNGRRKGKKKKEKEKGTE